MGSRSRSVVIALVLAALATAATSAYLFSLKNGIEEGGRHRSVLVAVTDIPAGTPAEELDSRQLVRKEQVPNRYVADGALASTRAVRERITSTMIVRGEQLGVHQFVEPGQAELSLRVPAGHIAVAVPVDEATGVSGKLRTADKVTVFAGSGGNSAKPATEIVLSDIQVLYVPEEQKDGASQTSAARSGRKTVVLSLTSQEAGELVPALKDGNIWIGLLPVPKVASNTSDQAPVSR